MDWNCANIEERLSDYLEGALAREDAAAFSSHAASCGNCAALVSQVRSLLGQMQYGHLAVAEPPQLVSRILGATVGVRPQKKGARKWFAWVPILWQPRFAMGMATVAASCVIVFHTAGVTPNKLKKVDLSPANLYRSANRQAHLAYARSVKFVNDLRVVYEIQSRLQPAPPPPPANEPHREPRSEAPAQDPQQKSQTAPRPRTQALHTEMFATILWGAFTRNAQ
jgi:anti-sigma factor RsiW